MTTGSDSPDYGREAEPKLVALARAGDVEAFTEIVRRRHGRIRSFMHYLCGSPDDGDDLAQQVLIKAWKTIGQLRSVAAFDAWLRRIMITTWIDVSRHRGLGADAATDPMRSFVHRESPGVAIDLKRALSTLPPAARLCVVLAYSEGLTHDEIAAVTRLPLGTVKSHVTRGAARLRDCLAAYRNVD